MAVDDVPSMNRTLATHVTGERSYRYSTTPRLFNEFLWFVFSLRPPVSPSPRREWKPPASTWQPTTTRRVSVSSLHRSRRPLLPRGLSLQPPPPRSGLDRTPSTRASRSEESSPPRQLHRPLSPPSASRMCASWTSWQHNCPPMPPTAPPQVPPRNQLRLPSPSHQLLRHPAVLDRRPLRPLPPAPRPHPLQKTTWM